MPEIPTARASFEVVWVCPNCLWTNICNSESITEEEVREVAGIQPYETVSGDDFYSIPDTDTCKSCNAEYKILMGDE